MTWPRPHSQEGESLLFELRQSGSKGEASPTAPSGSLPAGGHFFFSLKKFFFIVKNIKFTIGGRFLKQYSPSQSNCALEHSLLEVGWCLWKVVAGTQSFTCLLSTYYMPGSVQGRAQCSR